MRKIKFIILTFLSCFVLCLTVLIFYGGMRFFYTDDNYKWIDLRKTWPKGYWAQAKFVVMGNYGEEGIVFNVPLDCLGNFEQVLKYEVKRSPKSYSPRWDIYQLRIITTEGKYTSAVSIDTDKVGANTWKSQNLKQLLFKWGYSEPCCTYPDPNDPINRNK